MKIQHVILLVLTATAAAQDDALRRYRDDYRTGDGMARRNTVREVAKLAPPADKPAREDVTKFLCDALEDPDLAVAATAAQGLAEPARHTQPLARVALAAALRRAETELDRVARDRERAASGRLASEPGGSFAGAFGAAVVGALAAYADEESEKALVAFLDDYRVDSWGSAPLVAACRGLTAEPTADSMRTVVEALIEIERAITAREKEARKSSISSTVSTSTRLGDLVGDNGEPAGPKEHGTIHDLLAGVAGRLGIERAPEIDDKGRCARRWRSFWGRHKAKLGAPGKDG